MGVRVRYAPSPTGQQHIGGVRTALYNYLCAKSMGGVYILRIEDTDQERSTDEALQSIYAAFRWLGIVWDEGPDVGGPYGPYIQSERREIHTEYANQLVREGKAYECFCSEERLEGLRKQQLAAKQPIGYDRYCRNLSDAQRDKHKKAGIRSVIRFKVPLEGLTVFHDELLGDVKRKNVDIPADPVLLKSDGFPTYHLAHPIDDHLMSITHVLRAQEWLSSGPLHKLLFEAFGWDPPKFYHLSVILGKDGKKLSKRHGSTSVEELREAGYLPQAIINNVARLGWSYDDRTEIFDLKELEATFSLEKLTKSPAVFDYKKLDWLNGQYIRRMEQHSLRDHVLPILTRDKVIGDPPSEKELETVDRCIPLIHERLRLLGDASAMLRFLFVAEVAIDPADLIPKRLDRQKTIGVMRQALPLLEGFGDRSDEQNEDEFRKLADNLDVKLGDALMPLRIAVTGSKVSPPLFESIRVLGAQVTLARVKKALAVLSENSATSSPA